MRAFVVASFLALACSGGKSLVLVEVSAGDPGIALTAVDITATPAGGSAVTRHFDWNSTGGPLQAGLFLPASVEGAVSLRASGMDGVGAVEATGEASVKPGQTSERVALVLHRTGAPPPDGGGSPDGATPTDGGLPPDAQAADVATGDAAVLPDMASPDVPPSEPPTLTRCTVYEHAGACTLTPTTEGVGVWEVAFTPDGKYLLTGGDDGRVKVWQVTSTGLVDDNRSFIAGPNHSSVHFAFSADGARLAVGSGDTNVAVYEFPKMSRLATLTGHAGGIIHLAFSGDGARLVSIDNAMTAKVWDVATAKEQKTVTFPAEVHSYSLAPVNPPGSLWLATSDNNGTGFALRDLAADPVSFGSADTGLEVYALSFSPDGQKLAVNTADGKMTIWNVSDRKKPAPGPVLWPATGTAANAIIATEAVFSADGRFVAASGSLSMFSPGYIRIGAIEPPGLRASTPTDSAAMSIDWSRDGKAIATGSWRCGKITFCRD